MRVLRMDPMLLLTIVVGLGVLLTMKLATVNNSIVLQEDKAQQLKTDVYASPLADSERKNGDHWNYPNDNRFSKLSINSR